MTSCNARGQGIQTGIWFALSLIGMGTAFFLSQLNLLGNFNPWHFWPLLLVLKGIIKLFGPHCAGKYGVAALLIGGGTVIELHYLNYIDLRWQLIWPALIIIAGLAVFFVTFIHAKKRNAKAVIDNPTSAPSPNFFSGNVILGGRQENINSQTFEGGEIKCVLGGYELDFRDSKLKDDLATINIQIVMGGLELKVPKTWNVIIKAMPIMGGFEDKSQKETPADGTPSPTLIIDGSLVMGGIEIRN